jgi:hypothetical protein
MCLSMSQCQVHVQEIPDADVGLIPHPLGSSELEPIGGPLTRVSDWLFGEVKGQRLRWPSTVEALGDTMCHQV